MKKLISMLLTITLICGLSISTFASSETSIKDYKDTKTAVEKYNWFKSTFNTYYDGKSEWLVSIVGDAGKKFELKALDRVYSSFALIGISTTKKIFENQRNDPKFKDQDIKSNFQFHFDIDNLPDNSVFTRRRPSLMSFYVCADWRNNYLASVHDIVSGVFGVHYMTKLPLKEATWAMGQKVADMVVNGGDNPFNKTTSKISYEDYKIVYEELLKDYGIKSNAVIRSAAFLGIDLPAE